MGVEGVETVKSPPLGCVECGTPTPGLWIGLIGQEGQREPLGQLGIRIWNGTVVKAK